MNLAVIIPMKPGETAWTRVVPALVALPRGSEVIFASPSPPAGTAPAVDLSHLRVSWLETPLGRARQMNGAARTTSATHLWFLHADTILTPDVVPALRRALATVPDALHYFDLRFEGGPALMLLNRAGVWVRTRVLGLPFGDQAFCLPRAAFDRIGGYDESVAYGEDHILVWQAARAALPLVRVRATVATSARKYVEYGWFQTTARHLFLTYKQALPQWWQTRVKN